MPTPFCFTFLSSPLISPSTVKKFSLLFLKKVIVKVNVALTVYNAVVKKVNKEISCNKFIKNLITIKRYQFFSAFSKIPFD